jgi:S-adenosylmethionine:tRNA ribosyltransferase-isomerase
VRVSEFDFHLPEELIAQKPPPHRDASRMLHVQRASGTWSDRNFRDFLQLLRPGDLLVFNNTKVYPARLYGRRQGSRAQPVSRHNPAARDFLHGQIEVLLTRQLSTDPNDWECLVRPGRKIGVGEHLLFGEQGEGENEMRAEVLARGEFGERRIRFNPVPDFFAVLDRIGHVPLPPYISRAEASEDRDRYQTVYAEPRGSAAAPTAGLHFTPELLRSIHDHGIETTQITLHVGLGTFQPIRVDRVEDHRIHTEHYTISPEASFALNQAIRSSRRILAIGTTTVRALEHAIRLGSGSINPGNATADLFIYPGFEFKAVGALLTNFHLPQSSLLMLVCAFGGKENVLRAYEHAVSARYRFYSYGDCMFME